MQSRNFRLQRVGDIKWLERNYKFQKISFSLDELVVLNASRKDKNIEEFSQVVKRLVDDVFIPVAAGGGIRSLEDVDLLFLNGADKVVLNSTLYTNPELAKSIIEKYGSQSLVASVDYKVVSGKSTVFINDGSESVDIALIDYLRLIQEIGVGEVILNSIDRDGTGFGYDIPTLHSISGVLDIPLILMGGAGNALHLKEGLDQDHVSAVCTANLFNFIGNGLPKARQSMLDNNYNLAVW
ncbi:HisA/HisF-related TIM barrel protein [Vibrio cortegadensis]|uniref:HisA/HisF-related TIM barrel protein n=1 Tax=Vibrio cortegadensis TaxID=1328770 RepID=UPI0021C4A173|nr:HisA/HisF-related TIM barrel protein [Vibrio cortegadensis]MDN3697701.1 HisA/HisF-related TIM barrel protein [Vibrio cortegadensis]